MKRFLSRALIPLTAALLFPSLGLARDVDPDQDLTIDQKVQVMKFSQKYADLMNAIEARLTNSVDLRSPEAQFLLKSLNKCKVIERADGDLIEISGDKCEMSYEVFTLKRDLGFNESGDPITEVETTKYFASKSDTISRLTGFKVMKSTRLEHSETLISTPSYVKISTERMQFTTPDNENVEFTIRERLYTNMENEDETYYRMVAGEFSDFDVRFEIKTFTDYSGKIKSSESVLNKKSVELENLADIFTTYLLGVEI